MTKGERILLVSGLVIATLGFLVDRASEIPVVMRLLAPSHWAAMQAYEQLHSRHRLSPGDTGFEEVAEITLNEFRGVYKNIPAKPNAISHFELGASVLGGIPDLNLHFYFRGTPYRNTWTMNRLRVRIDELRGPRLLLFSSAFFFLGVCISALPLFTTRPTT